MQEPDEKLEREVKAMEEAMRLRVVVDGQEILPQPDGTYHIPINCASVSLNALGLL